MTGSSSSSRGLDLAGGTAEGGGERMVQDQAVLDARAARALYHYAFAVDTGDLDALRSMAMEDVRFTSASGTLVGIEPFLDIFRAQFSSEAEGVRHMVANVLAERLDDGRIQARAYFEAVMFQPNETQRIIGSYQDILCDIDGELKLAHKTIQVERVLSLPKATQNWASAGSDRS